MVLVSGRYFFRGSNDWAFWKHPKFLWLKWLGLLKTPQGLGFLKYKIKFFKPFFFLKHTLRILGIAWVWVLKIATFEGSGFLG